MAVTTDTLIRGDSQRWDVPLQDDLGNPYPLAGIIVRCVAKPAIDDDVTDANAIWNHRIEFDGAGAIVGTADGFVVESGALVEVLTPDEANAATFVPPGGVYDLQVTIPATNTVKTLLGSVPFTITTDVAREDA